MTDIIKYNKVFSFETPDHQELIVVIDFGDSGVIDLDLIEKAHINKYQKNVCLLLKNLDKHQLYHGNISLDNIILDNEELKISGLKPILETKENIDHWKI